MQKLIAIGGVIAIVALLTKKSQGKTITTITQAAKTITDNATKPTTQTASVTVPITYTGGGGGGGGGGFNDDFRAVNNLQEYPIIRNTVYPDWYLRMIGEIY